MQKRAFLAALSGGVLLASGALVACSSSSSSTVDAGNGRHDAGHDAGITVFEATVPDSRVVLPDVSLPDTGILDATVPDVSPPHDSGADRTVHDAGADGHTRMDTGVDTGVDAPKRDTGACTVVGVPGTTAGANQCTAPDANTCGPAVLTGFTPNPPPPNPVSSACKTGQVTAIYNDCLQGSTCPEQDTSNAAFDCFQCIFSNQTDPTWGPLVEGNGVVNVNTGGCLLLLEPCNTACSDAIEDDFLCDSKACGTNCPVTADAGSLTAFDTCAQAADDCDPGGCFKYGNGAYGGAGCINSIVGASHPGSVCFQSDFESAYLSVAAVFCGGS